MDETKKQKIKEIEAATEVVQFTIRVADKEWPSISKSLQDMFKEKFVIENESTASLDFLLALISIGLQSTKNIFTKDRAQRLSEYVTFCFDTDGYGEYAKKELEQYQKAFERYKETKNYPHDEVAARLLHRLLGKNIHNITVTFGEKKTDVLSPFVVSTLSSMLLHLLAPNPWKIIHDQYELVESDFNLDEVKKEVKKAKALPQEAEGKSSMQPQTLTDLIDKIDLYLEEMREKNDKKEIPTSLTKYIWWYFRDMNPDKEKLKFLALYLVDHIYRYAAYVTLTDEYTQLYFATVITELWNTIQARGIDTLYILDNELREDRFLLTLQLFALSGVAVVTPYVVKGTYHTYMTPEEQAEWVLSFNKDDFDPKKFTLTIDSSEEIRSMEVMELIKKYMEHNRNIVYIEKDASVNYLEDVKKLAMDSNYVCLFRNKAPDDPHILILSELDEDRTK